MFAKVKMWACSSTYDPYFQFFSPQRVLESRRSSGHRIKKTTLLYEVSNTHATIWSRISLGGVRVAQR